jgi:hypothetical protein
METQKNPNNPERGKLDAYDRAMLRNLRRLMNREITVEQYDRRWLELLQLQKEERR